MIKDLEVTRGTVVRTVLIMVTLVNLLLKAMGYPIIDVDGNAVAKAIECGTEVVIIALGFWKNNSFTGSAKNADFYLAKLRNFDTDEADSVFNEKE